MMNKPEFGDRAWAELTSCRPGHAGRQPGLTRHEVDDGVTERKPAEGADLMEKKTKGIVAGLIAVIVGAGLAFVGVCIWIDGNTGFGGAAIAIGALIVIAWISSVVDRRRKAKKT